MSKLHLEEKTNIKELIFPYLNKWKIISLSGFCALLITFFLVKFIAPNYKVSAEVIVKEDENSPGGLNPGSMLSDLSFGLTGMNNQIDNEIEILNSRSLLLKVANDLNLNIEVYEKNGAQNKELFGNNTFKLDFINKKGEDYLPANYKLSIVNKYKFELIDLKFDTKKTYFFGNPVNTINGKLLIIPKGKFKLNDIGKSYKISILPNRSVITKYKNLLKIERVNKESSAILITLKCKNINKGKAIINDLIKQHSIFAINDKNLVANNTLNFIDERLQFLSRELSDVEQNVSSFKSNNKIFDLSTSAQIFFQNESETQKLILENETQIKLADFIYDFIIKNKSNELLPSNLGLTNPSIEQTIQTINTLQLEKNKLTFYNGEKNPVIANLDSQISSLKQTLKESLNNQRNSLRITNRELMNRNSSLESKLRSAPKQEKDFKEIARQQQIKETLYLFLLQKREETSLALAVTTSNTKIIDEAYSDGIPISPNKKLFYIISLLLGALIPICFIYVNRILNNKIQSIEDINKIGIPVVGDLPLVKNTARVIIKKGDRSSIAEAFRIVRTNLSFLINRNKEGAKTIFVTSTFSNEGKSFISINLASTLAMTQKKVILLGLDLRAPKILNYTNTHSTVGVTNYIIDETLDIDSLIINSKDLEGVDILPSGIIPPNPAELLMTERMSEIINHLKSKYDYIIVDTAPVGLVTDTLLINDFADVTLYVVRANVLDKNSLPILEDAYKNNKLKNIAVLVNGVDFENGYGYGKGYGYGNYVNESKSKKFPLSLFK